MQAQAPICPFCYDDHSSLTECDPKELKKRILKEKFELYERTKDDIKQNGSIPETIRRMIGYL